MVALCRTTTSRRSRPFTWYDSLPADDVIAPQKKRNANAFLKVLRLRGGAKKRKKKVYTKPKKQKHKRKKVKLAVLKYYKVDENGKITRLRRECPAAECGAGIFMASHFDRQYCGKCGLTYVYNKPKEKESE